MFKITEQTKRERLLESARMMAAESAAGTRGFTAEGSRGRAFSCAFIMACSVSA